MNLSEKIILQRVEPNGTVNNITQDSTGKINVTPCA